MDVFHLPGIVLSDLHGLSHLPSGQAGEVGTVFVGILPIGKLRLGEGEFRPRLRR